VRADGRVWKAHDANLDRVVAIKMLLRGALGDATARERFRREALAFPALPPRCGQVFDFDTQNGHDFLVMEYVPGGTLESRLATGRCRSRASSTWAWPSPTRSRMPISMASSIANLKPGNVLLTADGQPEDPRLRAGAAAAAARHRQMTLPGFRSRWRTPC